MTHYTKRIIVKFRPHLEGSTRTSKELCDDIVEITGGVLVRPPSATGRAVFEVGSTLDFDDLIQKISALPSVEYAEPDVIDQI
jgi:hypothetical protein